MCRVQRRACRCLANRLRTLPLDTNLLSDDTGRILSRSTESISNLARGRLECVVNLIVHTFRHVIWVPPFSSVEKQCIIATGSPKTTSANSSNIQEGVPEWTVFPAAVPELRIPAHRCCRGCFVKISLTSASGSEMSFQRLGNPLQALWTRLRSTAMATPTPPEDY